MYFSQIFILTNNDFSKTQWADGPKFHKIEGLIHNINL